jgi:hypothetical protein
VLVPDEYEYSIFADELREAQAKKYRYSRMDDEDLQSRTSEERSVHRERGLLIGVTRNFSCGMH